MKRMIFAFATALTLSASGAMADGMPKGGGPAAAACCETVKPWRGFYIGLGAGAGAIVHELDVSTGGASVVNFDGIGSEGAFGTVVVGYDAMLSRNLVAGVFADYDFSGISSSLTAAGVLTASLDHEHSWSIGARVGVLTSPSTLWYATGGYTQASFDLGGSLGGTPFSLSLPDFKGFFIGGGVESQLSGNWSLRAEYRFTQFDSENVFSLGGVDLNVEPSMHTARIALTYKLARPEEHAAPLK